MYISLLFSYICLFAQFTQGSDAVINNMYHADIIFVGENIITMEDNDSSVNSIAIRGENIIAVGRADQILKYQGKQTQLIHLGEKALLPGFIDSHGHFTATARLENFINLSSPPVGPINNIDETVTLLRQHIARRNSHSDKWVVGYGYDDSLLAEKRHPTRDDLDKVSTVHPILLMHVSGHFATTNSRGLLELGINAETTNPEGGVIRRRPNSREPNGVFEEVAASIVLQGQLNQITGDRFIQLTRAAAKKYASFGITTVQDGAITPKDLALLKAAAENDGYILDIGAYVWANSLNSESYQNFRSESTYSGGVRQIGIKLSLDGSPQGRTAWMTEAYIVGPTNASANYFAYPSAEPAHYIKRAADLVQREIPIIVHANGDAAIDLMIKGVSEGLQRSPKPNHRSVIVHAQLMRLDQVKLATKLGILASFFPVHTYFWGDWHRISFGEKRAKQISPTRWAVDHNLKFTVHNDAPVVPPDMMRLLWATVNRATRSDFILGANQRLTTYEALRAMTLDGAYQFFEENTKGSLRAGKQADLVILDVNPLHIAPDKLKDIKILETFSRGQSIYRNE